MTSVDDMFKRLNLDGILLQGKLLRYWNLSQGRHKRDYTKPKNKDLVRMKGSGAGLPTIRSDLAGNASKIVLGDGKSLASRVVSQMTDHQKQTLQTMVG